MLDNFLEKVLDIKSRLNDLKSKTLLIPEGRQIEVISNQIENNPSILIYKPRFVTKEENIPQDIKSEIIKIFDDLDYNLLEYSPNSFEYIEKIKDLSPENKESLIFLLEKDIYATDKVYGEYLVETRNEEYKISYYRREKKVKNLPLKPTSIDLEDFIKNNAILQIQNQVEKLWKIIENEIDRCENRYKAQKIKDKEEKIKLLGNLLEKKECEYLDFKLHMHRLNDKDPKTKIHQQRELLKDILGLINNKKFDTDSNEAYLIIGVEEKFEKFTGNHVNVEFSDFQLIKQLIKIHIEPLIETKIDEYFLLSSDNGIQISTDFLQNSNRIILCIFYFELGIVYELKKRIGNPSLNIDFFNEGTSFIRDGSHTMRMSQQDRRKIMSLRYEIYDFEEVDQVDYYEPDEELSSREINYEINVDLISNYIEILKTTELSLDSQWDILSPIKDQIDIFINFYDKNKQSKSIIFDFIRYACDYIKDNNDKITRRLLFFLDDLSGIPAVLKYIKIHCLKTFEFLFKKGEFYSHLISLLNSCGYYNDLINEVFIAIDKNNVKYLESLIYLDFQDPQFISYVFNSGFISSTNIFFLFQEFEILILDLLVDLLDHSNLFYFY
ncbi:hypothetical protein LCGC14_0757120 [marine sediment metagenome]|uniref:Schlafen AlbA-2 domain-containing protein n=1 Tax=marine sediment metagenome TaxID=412755 RepID=A0A0F9QM36_9ZZZZ|nr:MAG: hypothetical protein Lokiarch_17650 [Candidatus Lokiarchaeum sp. GC14_75]HEC37918.1 hypothetical protein [bacterium]